MLCCMLRHSMCLSQGGGRCQSWCLSWNRPSSTCLVITCWLLERWNSPANALNCSVLLFPWLQCLLWMCAWMGVLISGSARIRVAYILCVFSAWRTFFSTKTASVLVEATLNVVAILFVASMVRGTGGNTSCQEGIDVLKLRCPPMTTSMCSVVAEFADQEFGYMLSACMFVFSSVSCCSILNVLLSFAFSLPSVL